MKAKKFLTAATFALLGLTASAAYDTTESESLKVWYTDPLEVVNDGATVSYLTVYEHDDIDYSAFNMVFVLPEGLRVNQVKSGRDYVDDIRLSDRATIDHAISCNIVDDTLLKVVCFSPESKVFYNTDADEKPLDELFTVGLIADEGMAPGEYPIYMTDIKFVMSDGNACIPADMPVYGTLVVKDPNDNKDSESLKVWYTDPVKFVADGTTVTYLSVYEHDDVDYSAFNMYFVMPEGLRVNQVKSGRDYVDDIKLSERASSTHTISCNIVDDTLLKIVCFSPESKVFYNTDADEKPLDELFTVGLIADEGMAPGEYPIYLTDIKFVMADGNACIPADMPVYGTLVVEDPNVTGVNDIEAGELGEGDFFNFQGLKVDPKACKGQILIHNGRKVRVK